VASRTQNLTTEAGQRKCSTGNDEDIPNSAAVTTTVTPPPLPPHAGEKRTHEQAAGVPAAQKRARLPPGRNVDMQEGGRGEETAEGVEAANTAELKRKMEAKGRPHSSLA
jgi:hypothetical protein